MKAALIRPKKAKESQVAIVPARKKEANLPEDKKG